MLGRVVERPGLSAVEEHIADKIDRAQTSSSSGMYVGIRPTYSNFGPMPEHAYLASVDALISIPQVALRYALASLRRKRELCGDCIVTTPIPSSANADCWD